MGALSKLNYPPSVISFIQNALQIAFVGELQFVVPAASGNDGYRQELEKWGVPAAHMHTLLSTAEDAMTGDRNDVVCVMPGKYTETASITWDKAHTHIVGMGGPNTRGHYRTSSESDMSNTIIHTVTTPVAEVINVTGENCQFHNVHIHNEGSHASNVAALKINKYGFYGKNLAIRGATGTDALSAVEAGSLYVHTDADYLTMEDCTIGHNTYSAGLKTGANSGHLVFSATGGPQNGLFKNCYFPLRSHTATAGCVRFANSTCLDRDWIFDNCLFTNWYQNWIAKLNNVFAMTPPYAFQTTNIVVRRCTAQGFAEWQNLDISSVLTIDMPAVDDGGGLTGIPDDGSAI